MLRLQWGQMQDGNIYIYNWKSVRSTTLLDAASTCGLGAGNLCLGANLHDSPRSLLDSVDEPTDAR